MTTRILLLVQREKEREKEREREREGGRERERERERERGREREREGSAGELNAATLRQPFPLLFRHVLQVMQIVASIAQFENVTKPPSGPS